MRLQTQAVGGKLWQAAFPLPLPSFSLHLLTDSLLTHSFLAVSLLHQLPRVLALLRGHPSKFLHRPCSVNCSEKIYYVPSRQRDSDHTNKLGGGGVKMVETVAGVGILL